MKKRKTKTKSEQELSKLRTKYKSLIKELRQIEKENIEILTQNSNLEGSINNLPLQTLKDFYDFENFKELNNSLLINLRKNTDLHKEFLQKEKELISISNEIKIKTIDILIEKVKLLEESIK